MSIFRKNFLFIIIILFSTQIIFAQKGWNINRAKGTGDLISVFFTSSDVGWVAGDEGYLAFTNDGGKSWQRKILNTVANINEIYFRSDDDGYLVAGRKMFVTKDGGSSWREALIVNPNEFKDGIPEFLSIRFNSKKQGFIVGTIIDKNNDNSIIGSLLLKTTDGGESWSRIIVPTKVELFHLDFDGKSHGWIVGDLGTILSTTNNGVSWEIQESGTKETLFNVDFRDENEGYVVGSNGTILITENGGTNWRKVDTYVKDKLFRVDFSDDKNGWIVGADGTVLHSVDRGKTWAKQLSNTKNNLYGLFMQKKYGWSVGRDGIIIQYEK